MAYLVLVRHGQSEWNALGQWTGLTDIPLNDEGRAEARKAATVLEDIELHRAYSSPLSRARETLDIVLAALKKSHLPVTESRDIIERDYGELKAAPS
jgi:bisphosphoglycerate-dependent phosphoglycerate mutase family 1